MKTFLPFGALAGCVLSGVFLTGKAQAQAPAEAGSSIGSSNRVASLALPPATATNLKRAMEEHRYTEAQAILLPLVTAAQADATTARRLAYLGGIYYLAHDFPQSIVALKKSAAIAPLAPSVQFTLAMSEIRIGHPDWATGELRQLASVNPQEPLYPYWLGRIAYGAHHYEAAVQRFQLAIKLAPNMARGYDNLGLCYFYLNQNALAIEQFQRAITLENDAPHPSAWPYLNLGIAQATISLTVEAEQSFRRALELDPHLSQAHFQLANVLIGTDRLKPAADELRAAAQTDPASAEPHFALARLYRRLGQPGKAAEEVAIYKRLHAAAATAGHDGPQIAQP